MLLNKQQFQESGNAPSVGAQSANFLLSRGKDLKYTARIAGRRDEVLPPEGFEVARVKHFKEIGNVQIAGLRLLNFHSSQPKTDQFIAGTAGQKKGAEIHKIETKRA